MTVPQLKDLLRKREMRVSGNKNDLINRLKLHDTWTGNSDRPNFDLTGASALRCVLTRYAVDDVPSLRSEIGMLKKQNAELLKKLEFQAVALRESKRMLTFAIQNSKKKNFLIKRYCISPSGHPHTSVQHILSLFPSSLPLEDERNLIAQLTKLDAHVAPRSQDQ